MMIDFDGLADESLVDEPSSALVYESGKPHLLFEASLFQKYKRGRNAFRKTSNTSPKICAPYQSKFFPTEQDDDGDGSSKIIFFRSLFFHAEGCKNHLKNSQKTIEITSICV